MVYKKSNFINYAYMVIEYNRNWGNVYSSFLQYGRIFIGVSRIKTVQRNVHIQTLMHDTS